MSDYGLPHGTDSLPTALVVEDHEHIAFLLEQMLLREGFDVDMANDGKQAAEYIARRDPVGIVVLDVMLPYQDGFEVLRLIRAHSDWRRVPVIMLSARNQEGDVVRALNAGANDYVCKPYKPAELLARIKRAYREAHDAVAV
jgi:DNA-binding response OmpR family regulator